MAIAISGRGSNMESLARAVQSGRIPARIRAVISNNPEAAGLKTAAEFGIRRRLISEPAELDDALREAGVGPDGLLCLAGFMRIVPESVVNKYTVMNIHPALLPAFPGLGAVKQAIRGGVRYSGCTVHFADAGVDTGPIILQAAVPVLGADTEAELAARILEWEHVIYPLAVRLYAEGRLRVEDGRVAIDADPRDVELAGLPMGAYGGSDA